MVALTVLVLLTSPFIPSGARMIKRRGTIRQDLNSTIKDVPANEDVVDAVFTFGAPGVASPAIVNQRTQSGCFNGLRMYLSQETPQVYGKFIDPVPSITNNAYYWHSKMSAREVDTRRINKYATMACGVADATEKPPRFPGKWNFNLHDAEKYLQTVMKFSDPLWEDFAVFALVAAYMDDVALVANVVRKQGWKLVGMAKDDGDGFLQGPQVSHLMQKPETLECVITFEGTDNDNGRQDWDANFDKAPEKFCGLAGEDEQCGSFPYTFGACTVKSGNSFVHRGFANRARSIARSDSWKSAIQGNLPACSKVSVVGHSAGGAVAELVAACLSKTLAPDAFGYDDRSLFGWFPSTPVELPELDA